MLPMKPDLEELMITHDEIKDCTGYEKVNSFFPFHNESYEEFFTLFFVGLIGLIIFLISELFPTTAMILQILIFGIMFGPVIFGLYIFWKSYRSGVYSKILQSIEKHNQIITNLHTLDQLAEVGNPVKISDRAAVMEALTITRDGLVRALKTERILRENPNFKPEHFNIDLSYIEAERAEINAIEYAELLNDALQIGVSVQTQMRKLRNKQKI